MLKPFAGAFESEASETPQVPTWKIRCKSMQVSETWWPEYVDRADVYDDESEDASKRRQVTLVLVSQCALMLKRKSLAKYRDLHVTLM